MNSASPMSSNANVNICFAAKVSMLCRHVSTHSDTESLYRQVCPEEVALFKGIVISYYIVNTIMAKSFVMTG